MKGIELVFFRHGIAADTLPDRERPLTEEGMRKTRAAAEGLKKLEIPIERIFTSPWVRATQTAAILSEVLMLPVAEVMNELAGDRPVRAFLDAIPRVPCRGMMFVGHQPLLGEAAAELLGAGRKCEIDIRKAGACSIRVDAIPPRRPAVLQWLLTAKQLRAQS
jgi:phosphohistidine phosphatase